MQFTTAQYLTLILLVFVIGMQLRTIYTESSATNENYARHRCPCGIKKKIVSNK